MAYSSYSKQTWADAPATSSPLSAARLGNIESGLANLDANNNGAFCPADYGWLAWAYDPYIAYAAALLGTAGLNYLTLIPIRQACTITNILCFVGTAGASLTSGQNLLGLFDNSGNLLSATGDQTSAWGSTGLKTAALSSSQAVSPGLYYAGFLWNGSTAPKFSYNAACAPGQGANSGPYPRSALDSTHTGRTTSFANPSTITAFTLAAFWAALS